MNHFPHITTNPRIAGGKPIIAGTRITVEGILIRRRRGEDPEVIAHNLGLTVEQVQEAEQYAQAVQLHLPTPEEEQAELDRLFNEQR